MHGSYITASRLIMKQYACHFGFLINFFGRNPLGDLFENNVPQHLWLFSRPSKYFKIPAQVLNFNLVSVCLLILSWLVVFIVKLMFSWVGILKYFDCLEKSHRCWGKMFLKKSPKAWIISSVVNFEIVNKQLTLFTVCFFDAGMIGDLICDDGPNTLECNFDGADCCNPNSDFSHCINCECLHWDNYTLSVVYTTHAPPPGPSCKISY